MFIPPPKKMNNHDIPFFLETLLLGLHCILKMFLNANTMESGDLCQ